MNNSIRCFQSNSNDYRKMNPEEFTAMVKERAYQKAQKRGFEPGHELDDWLEAEKELDNQCHYWHQEFD